MKVKAKFNEKLGQLQISFSDKKEYMFKASIQVLDPISGEPRDTMTIVRVIEMTVNKLNEKAEKLRTGKL